jgi:hypothetical protein
LRIAGWNECLIAYVLAAASENYPVDPDIYHDGFVASPSFRNGKLFHGVELPLGVDFGGPLFFAHYSFCGLDPRGLRDRHADYWEQNVRHAHQPCPLRRQSARLQRLRARLLGPDRQSRPPPLWRTQPVARYRRHHAERSAIEFPLLAS